MPDGLNYFYDSHRVTLPIGMKHPGCGGELLASTSCVCLSMTLVDRLYSLHGKSVNRFCQILEFPHPGQAFLEWENPTEQIKEEFRRWRKV